MSDDPRTYAALAAKLSEARHRHVPDAAQPVDCLVNEIAYASVTFRVKLGGTVLTSHTGESAFVVCARDCTTVGSAYNPDMNIAMAGALTTALSGGASPSGNPHESNDPAVPRALAAHLRELHSPARILPPAARGLFFPCIGPVGVVD